MRKGSAGFKEGMEVGEDDVGKQAISLPTVQVAGRASESERRGRANSSHVVAGHHRP